jgi:hypothetical protein
MNKQNILNQFSPYLFWETDLADLDLDNNAYYIIPRVLDYGTLKDVSIVYDNYSEELIRKVLLSVPSLHVRTISYFSLQYGIKEEEFRAYRNMQGNPNWK